MKSTKNEIMFDTSAMIARQAAETPKGTAVSRKVTARSENGRDGILTPTICCGIVGFVLLRDVVSRHELPLLSASGFEGCGLSRR